MNKPGWLTSAIARLLVAKPYLAPIAIRIDWREKENLGTVAVDNKGRGYFDPALIEKRPEWAQFMPQLVEHEMQHVLRRHFERGDALNAKKKSWNVATDAEINDDLGVDIPELIYPETLRQPRGLLAEDYYKEIVSREQDTQDGASDDDGGGEEGAGGGGEGKSGESEDNSGGESGGESDSRGNGENGESGDDEGDSGQPSGKRSGGDTEARGSASGPQPGCGGLKDLDPSDERPGWTEQERKAIEKEVAREVVRQIRRNRGTGIGNELLQWAMEQLQPLKDHWTVVLERMLVGTISSTGRDIDRSRRPSGRTTRWAVRWKYRQTGGRLGVLVDVSGSMTADLPLAFSVIQRAVASRDLDLVIMACDERPSGPYKSLNDLVGSARGGGGTDLRNGIEALMQHGCDAIFVITDGLTPWPGKVDVPVLVGLTEECPGVPFPTVLLKEERHA